MGAAAVGGATTGRVQPQRGAAGSVLRVLLFLVVACGGWAVDGARASGGDEKEVHAAPNAMILLAMSVGIATLLVSRALPKRFRLPYTCVVFLLGMATAALVKFLTLGPVMDASVNLMREVEPGFILLVLLPPLLFESAAGVDFHVFWKVSGQSLLLAFPGVVLNMGLTGCLAHLLLHEYHGDYWGWTESFLLGSILAATDPVAVVAALSDLGAPAKLSSLIEGESLLNDGSAFVFFLMLKGIVAGSPLGAAESVGFFLQLALGGPAWGLLCAFIAYGLLRLVYNDPVLEVSIVVFSVFSIFFIAEDLFHVSGVLAVVVFGLAFSYRVKFAISPEVEHTHHSLWMQLAFVANTLIFFISGLLVLDRVGAPDVAEDDAPAPPPSSSQAHDVAGGAGFSFLAGQAAAPSSLVPSPSPPPASDEVGIGRMWYDWGVLLGLYVGIHIVRTLVILILYPILNRLGYGLPWKNAAILMWGGLRGAVGLALGLLLSLDTGVNQRTSEIVNFHVSGIVFLTLIVNGVTTEFVYSKVLGLGAPSKALEDVALNALTQIEQDCDESLDDYVETFFTGLEVTPKKAHVKMLSPDLSKARFTANGIKVALPNAHDLESEPDFQKKKQLGATLLQATIAGALTGTWDDLDHTVVDVEVGSEARAAGAAGGGLLGGSVSGPPGLSRRASSRSVLGGGPSLPDSQHGSLARRNETMARLIEESGEGVARELTDVFFNAVKAAYHHLFEEGFLSGNAITLLRDAADDAQERGVEAHSCIRTEWEHLNASLRSLNNNSARGFVDKIPHVGTLLEYETVAVHVQALSAFQQAHKAVLQQNVVCGLSNFASDVSTACHMARASLEQMARTNPSYVRLASTVLLAQLVTRAKRDRVSTAFAEGLLDSGTTKALVSRLDRQLASLRDFVPQFRFVRATSKSFTVEKHVKRRLKREHGSSSMYTPPAKTALGRQHRASSSRTHEHHERRHAYAFRWHSTRAQFVRHEEPVTLDGESGPGVELPGYGGGGSDSNDDDLVDDDDTDWEFLTADAAHHMKKGRRVTIVTPPASSSESDSDSDDSEDASDDNDATSESSTLSDSSAGSTTAED